MHRLEKAMIQKNSNFEEFMDFRDMIQGDSLDDRMEMVQLLQDQEPVLQLSHLVILQNAKKQEQTLAPDSLA